MREAERAALTEASKALQEQIVWGKYPKLAAIFEHRPPVNVYWHELTALVRELRES